MLDEKVPSRLLDIQRWFASVITRPLEEGSRMQAISPSGHPMEQEATSFILPSSTLRADQRIELYNQQYWWRLIKIFQESFPTLLRLFGYGDLNDRFAVPYLLDCPPDHWSLNALGTRFPDWLFKNYLEEDRDFLFHCARVDDVFFSLFFSSAYPPLEAADLALNETDLLETKTFVLQPYVKVFRFPCNLLPFRTLLLRKEVDYWIENDFPPLCNKQDYAFIIERKPHQGIFWESLSLHEYNVLSLFEKGASIDSVCEKMEEWDAPTQQVVADNLSSWFHKWSQNQWLTCHVEKSSWMEQP